MPELVPVIAQRQRCLDIAGKRREAPEMVRPGVIIKAVEPHCRRRAVVPPANPVHRKGGRLDMAVEPVVERQMRL